MRVVQTLVVRDEVDIVDAQIAYHLNAGIDFVIAADHESQDGTTEILESYVRRGHARRILVSGEVRESDWRTLMARLAATEHGADWVINTDADEFWMPLAGTLEENLAAIPEGYGIVSALSRHFVPRPETEEFFAERMTVRFAGQSPLNDPTSPFRPHAKVAHRADPRIVVGFGGHVVRNTRLVPLAGLYPADILHFPFRTLAQYERKGVRRAGSDKKMGQYVRAFEAREAGRLSGAWDTLMVDDAQLERGRAQRSLVDDVRLRDVLRALRIDAAGRRMSLHGFSLPVPGSRLALSTGPARDVERRAELAALHEANLVRAWRTIDGLAVRIGRTERARGDGTRDRGRGR